MADSDLASGTCRVLPAQCMHGHAIRSKNTGSWTSVFHCSIIQFSSACCLSARESTYALRPFSVKFITQCLKQFQCRSDWHWHRLIISSFQAYTTDYAVSLLQTTIDFCSAADCYRHLAVAVFCSRLTQAIDGSVSLACLLYTSPSPRDVHKSRMPSSA